MFKHIAIAAVALSLSSPLYAKSRVQYEVCAVDPGGKLGVYEVTEKRPQAMAIAAYLTGKDKSHRHFFVVVQELDDKGDVK